MANPPGLQRQIAQYKAEIAELEKEVESLREELAEAEIAELDREAAQDLFRELLARIGDPSVRQLPIDLRLLVEQMCDRLEMALPG